MKFTLEATSIPQGFYDQSSPSKWKQMEKLITLFAIRAIFKHSILWQHKDEKLFMIIKLGEMWVLHVIQAPLAHGVSPHPYDVSP